MANVSHASLTGVSLHEPKGVATAAANTVYAADGSGSGAWTNMNTLVTSTNFTTGDAKLTFKASADSGWVFMNDGTIGDALSGASTRANSDCEALFTLFWNNISNTYAAVSGGRGANAAADWAAHKTIALPKELGRALIIGGNGSGLTNRNLGETGGFESVALSEAQLPAHSHTFSGTTSGGSPHSHNGPTDGHTHTYEYPVFDTLGLQTGPSNLRVYDDASTTQISGGTNAAFTTTSESSHTHTFNATSSLVGSTSAHTNMQPFSAINIMVKL